MFKTIDDVRASFSQLSKPDADALGAAQARNAVLTKPAGALGRLEDLAIWFASWRGTATPALDHPQVVIFAANHGIAQRGVSAFPAEVTAQMVANFDGGGAAINQLAKLAGAQFRVEPMSLDNPTQDFTKGPAMSEAEFLAAINTGANAVELQTDLLILGEMGIGNTTSAAAIYYAVLGGQAQDWVGRGTGVNAEGVSLKAKVIEEGLAANPQAGQDALKALQMLGGREIAAMFGAMMRARALRIPMILDGFIATSAAVVAYACDPAALDHIVAGHVSDEHAHRRAIEHIGKAPLLDLGLRLGEGSGAALAIQILKAALACHNGMASFAEAGVSEE